MFYTGCNVLKTPHIALLALDIMDALGISYQVMGGPSHCCGILQLKSGDAEMDYPYVITSTQATLSDWSLAQLDIPCWEKLIGVAIRVDFEGHRIGHIVRDSWVEYRAE